MLSAALALPFISALADDALVPLQPKLPAPSFIGTPKDLPPGVDLEPAQKGPPPPLMIPKDARNIAPNAKLSSSDQRVTAADLAKLTDGDKEPTDESTLLLRKGSQYVQFDLGGTNEIYAIVIWHSHDTPKIFRDVIVQLSGDRDFTGGVKTIYNNDRSNETGLGAGQDKQYVESYRGKTIDAKGAPARFVRLYSHGSTDSALNVYTEVEIYGRPAK